MSVKALICDDDTECRELTVSYFVRYCEDRGINYSYDSCDNAQDAIISEKAYDIAFLDVELGEKTGLDVAKFLKIRNKNVIIFFITEYEKYIDDAMNLFALRFIKKPLNYERFYKGLDKAH